MHLFRLYIELTTRCGLSCDFCPPHKQNTQVMPLDRFERLAFQAATLTRELSLHVMGDPLMVENLSDYLEIAHRAGLKVSITTAGHHFLASFDEMLLHPAIKQVNFSLSSFEANTQQRSLEEYLQPLIGYARQASAGDRIFVNFRLWNLGPAADAPPLNTRIEALLAGAFEWQPHEGFVQLLPRVRLLYDRRFEWPDPAREPFGGEGFCHGAGGQLAVLSDGRIVPCCLDAQGAMTLGEVETMSLSQSLQTPRAKAMREGFKQGVLIEPLCQRCGYIERFNRQPSSAKITP